MKNIQKESSSLNSGNQDLYQLYLHFAGLLGWDVSTIARVKNFRDTIFFKQKRMKKFDDLVGCFLSISFYGMKLQILYFLQCLIYICSIFIQF